MAAEKFYLNFGAVALIVDTRSVAVGSRGTLAGIVRQRPTRQFSRHCCHLLLNQFNGFVIYFEKINAS